jgi:hypothetical protein
LECHEASKHHLLEFDFLLLNDKPWFLTKGRFVAVLIIPSSWGFQQGCYLAASEQHLVHDQAAKHSITPGRRRGCRFAVQPEMASEVKQRTPRRRVGTPARPSQSGLSSSRANSTEAVTRVDSTNLLNEGLRIGKIGRQMNSTVKLVKTGVYRK